jgi:hypothetical protein
MELGKMTTVLRFGLVKHSGGKYPGEFILLKRDLFIFLLSAPV